MCLHTNTEIARAMGRNNPEVLTGNWQGAQAIVISTVRQDFLK
jgi:hypothetical protein